MLPNLPKQKGHPMCSICTNFTLMNIDDTLNRAFANLKIVGQITTKNLLNNLEVDCKLKLYSHNERLNNLGTSDERHLKLIVCNGTATPKGDFDLKKYNQKKKKLQK